MQGQWLWSFNQTQQCLSIQHLSLYNISRGEETDVNRGQELGTDGRAAVCQSASVSAHFLSPFLFVSLSLISIHCFLSRCQIAVSVEGLPSLGKREAYSCFFQDTETPASFTNTGVVCPTPDASSLPPISHGDGKVLNI